MRFVSLLVAVALAAAACGGGEDLGGEKMPLDVEVVVPASAEAMGEVTSVRFELERTGAAVYIDPLETLVLDEVIGRFAAPASADAVLTVRVSGDLTIKLGAVAIDDEAWLSNPVTGEFEPLPASYGIDPSLFFDPEDGWRPLLATLSDAELVGEEDRGGTRYRVRALASAEAIERVTAGLVEDTDVEVDLWIHPVSAHVTAAEFTTDVGDGPTDWVLELRDFDADVTIEPPDLD